MSQNTATIRRRLGLRDPKSLTRRNTKYGHCTMAELLALAERCDSLEEGKAILDSCLAIVDRDRESDVAWAVLFTVASALGAPVEHDHFLAVEGDYRT